MTRSKQANFYSILPSNSLSQVHISHMTGIHSITLDIDSYSDLEQYEGGSQITIQFDTRKELNQLIKAIKKAIKEDQEANEEQA